MLNHKGMQKYGDAACYFRLRQLSQVKNVSSVIVVPSSLMRNAGVTVILKFWQPAMQTWMRRDEADVVNRMASLVKV